MKQIIFLSLAVYNIYGWNIFTSKQSFIRSYDQSRFFSVTKESNVENDKQPSSNNKEIEDLANLVGQIMKAVDEGRESDLEKAGMRVSKRPVKDIINENISDERINSQILGEIDEDQIEIMRALEISMKSDAILSSNGYDDTESSELLSTDEISEIITEAEDNIRKFRETGQTFTKILESDNFDFDTWSSENNQDYGIDSILTPIIDILDESPPQISTGSRLEVEEWDESVYSMYTVDDAIPEVLPAAATTKKYGFDYRAKQKLHSELPISQLPEQSVSIATTGTGSDLPESGYFPEVVPVAAAPQVKPPPSTPESTSIPPVLDPVQTISSVAMEQTFQSLLQVTMEDATAPRELSGEMVGTTVQSIQSGDFAVLDVKSLIGDTLSALTSELGIDMGKELTNSQSQDMMRKIVGSSMAELAQNMAELELESQGLYNQLTNLSEALKEETEEFEERKQDELEQLLTQQKTLTTDYMRSQATLKATSDQLRDSLSNIENSADFITALALFPLKSNDKKAAFVVGLALLLKLPFDITSVFQIRSSDFTDWFTIFTQLTLCVTLFSHYGLVKAFLNPKLKF